MSEINHDLKTIFSLHVTSSECPCEKCGCIDFVLEKKVGKYLTVSTSTCEKCGNVSHVSNMDFPHRK